MNETECLLKTSVITYGRTQLIYDVRNVVLRMKFEISRSVRFPGREPRRHHIEFDGNLPLRDIVIKFTYEILSEIGHVGHLPDKRVQHERVRVGIRLTRRNSVLVVEGMVDPSILFGARDHLFPHVRIIRVLDTTNQCPCLGIHGNDDQG